MSTGTLCAFTLGRVTLCMANASNIRGVNTPYNTSICSPLYKIRVVSGQGVSGTDVRPSRSQSGSSSSSSTCVGRTCSIDSFTDDEMSKRTWVLSPPTGMVRFRGMVSGSEIESGSVGGSVGGSKGGSVGGSVGGFVGGSKGGSVGGSVGGFVGGSVGDSMSGIGAVGSIVGDRGAAI